MQGVAHGGKVQLRLIPEAEQSLGASEPRAVARNLKHFIGRHGVGARFPRVAAEGAVAAVVTAEVGEREEDLARIGDDAGLKALFEGRGGRKQSG